MDAKEILEYNKRCAEFLSMEKDAFLLAKQIEKNTNVCHLIFHSDWNWIMKVVEAIEKIQNTQLDILGNYCRICHKGMDFTFSSKESKKEAIVQAINQFLIWYDKVRKYG